MNQLLKRSLIGMLTLTVLVFSQAVLFAAAPSEEALIADLASPKEGVVTDALQKLEKNYPTSTNAFSAIKKLLTDPRSKVQRKAARVLGVLHAPVDKTDLDNICKLLRASEKREIMDGLIALRGLKAENAIPEILPLLDNPDSNVKRDACRTLAVLGDKSLIPKLEPLLSSPEPAVKKDAADAIYILKQKP
jgi:HEAT repeat protein